MGGRATVFDGIAHTLYLPRCTEGVSYRQSGAANLPSRVRPASQRPTSVPGPRQTTSPQSFAVATMRRAKSIHSFLPAHRSSDWWWSKCTLLPDHGAASHHTSTTYTARTHKADSSRQILRKCTSTKSTSRMATRCNTFIPIRRSPLHQQGHPIDALIKVANNEAVIVPEGYHPVVSPPGYTTYYLNVLAGSAQSLACVDDPDHAWIRNAYQTRDTRVPLYPLPKEPKYEN